jgi:hypothetical protein
VRQCVLSNDQRISIKAAFQLIGSDLHDWVSAERYLELEQAELNRRRHIIFAGTTPLFDGVSAEFRRAELQYEAVSRWLFDHGFSSRESDYDLAALKSAIANDPLTLPTKPRQRQRQANDRCVAAYVKKYITESKKAGCRPSQVGLWKSATKEEFAATRKRLFDALDAEIPPTRGRSKKSPK